jgi:SAM-dependent methyltransferase
MGWRPTVTVHSRDLYEIDEYWEQFTLTPMMEEKIRILREMMPRGVRSVLDLGCGNGLITNRLDDALKVVGLDWSRAALRHVERPCVCASALALPIKAGAFDLVLCSQLLEHLTDTELRETAGELLHLAPHFLLLSVPDNENLHINELRCRKCHLVFNASHHKQSFSAESVAALFTGYSLRAIRNGGPPVRAYPIGLLRIRQRLGGRWYPLPPERTVMCPGCGNRSFPRASYNPVSILCDGMNRMISRRHPYWLFVLLERR